MQHGWVLAFGSTVRKRHQRRRFWRWQPSPPFSVKTWISNRALLLTSWSPECAMPSPSAGPWQLHSRFSVRLKLWGIEDKFESVDARLEESVFVCVSPSGCECVSHTGVVLVCAVAAPLVICCSRRHKDLKEKVFTSGDKASCCRSFSVVHLCQWRFCKVLSGSAPETVTCSLSFLRLAVPDSSNLLKFEDMIKSISGWNTVHLLSC